MAVGGKVDEERVESIEVEEAPSTAVEFVVVYFYYIETRNTPLEEIVKYFDGEQALLGGDLATEKARTLMVEEGIETRKNNASHFESRVSTP